MYTMSVRSPSGAPAPATASADLVTGRLSPVSADSSTSSVAAFSSRPSAGTISPASIATMSPGTSCPAGISASWPSRLTLAVMIIIFCRAATAAAAFPSWCRPRTALNSVSKISKMPVPSCLSGYRLPMPAASSTICIGSRYWRRNACQRGSALAAASLFGPNRRARAAASAELRPRCASAPSERRTSSALSVCHASSPAAEGRPDPSVSAAPELMPTAYCLVAGGSGAGKFSGPAPGHGPRPSPGTPAPRCRRHSAAASPPGPETRSNLLPLIPPHEPGLYGVVMAVVAGFPGTASCSPRSPAPGGGRSRRSPAPAPWPRPRDARSMTSASGSRRAPGRR